MESRLVGRTLRLTAVLGAVAAATATVWTLSVNARAGGDGADSHAMSASRQVTVHSTPMRVHVFEERVQVQGTLKAVRYADVAARIGGPLESILVSEGNAVVAGETILFQIDSANLERTLQIVRQDLDVAKCALRESQANRERLQAILDKAKLDFERSKRLYEQSVGSLSRVEQLESEYKQADASIRHADSQVDLASEKVEQAQTAVEISAKNLRDSRAVAPINGRVSVQYLEAGENASVGEPVIRIEDPSTLEVSVYLPAQYYPGVVAGQTQVDLDVYSICIPGQTVSYKSPTIDPALRTFEVRCVLSDPPDCVVPGAMADARIILQRHEGLGVPVDAVQERDGRPVIFIVDSDVARMTPVAVGLQSDGLIECHGEGLAEGLSVVTLGQYLLNDGDSIRVEHEAG
ncbi:MAG: efflux RND transporter periplasmic adaptor subunit [Candidatus Hydrogenedentes bacterium]|nr:efflux RND transporter periplasmic adaptor subunit [Candidatus Hydrogenedentota bacterium]